MPCAARACGVSLGIRSEFPGPSPSIPLLPLLFRLCNDQLTNTSHSYLGDTLVHFSFPLLLFASNSLQPIHLLGPLLNYLFLRYVSGDKENEQSQARRYSTENVNKKIDFDKYRREENAFWPDKSQVTNKWTWYVVGAGVAGALLEGLVTKVLFA